MKPPIDPAATDMEHEADAGSSRIMALASPALSFLIARRILCFGF